ncbi:HIRAN domain-containing protein [Burkholderia ambifaria]|uniref:HIRAN domain-containing protein n=1 Tax=Burkholderia ambifaria TaxID=152480 RepID=UPI002FDF0B04
MTAAAWIDLYFLPTAHVYRNIWLIRIDGRTARAWYSRREFGADVVGMLIAFVSGGKSDLGTTRQRNRPTDFAHSYRGSSEMLWIIFCCFIIFGLIGVLALALASRSGPLDVSETPWADTADSCHPECPTDGVSSALGRLAINGSGEEDDFNPPRGRQRFLPPIPKDFQIYVGHGVGISVVGIQYRRRNALRFAVDCEQTLLFEREPYNPHDPNAIKVIGVCGSSRDFIGYVPRDLASQLVESELVEVVQPRLISIWCSGGGYVDIAFQIVGPKKRKVDFDRAPYRRPASEYQMEFLKFFNLPISKGLTIGQARTVISEHRKKLESENRQLLDDWDAYEDIREQFDDSDFREIYFLKKISSPVLKEALDELRRDGQTMCSLVDDVELVVDKIIQLRPELEHK